MDYVITNHRFYLRIKDGRPETCSKSDRQYFEYSKAKNILDNLPKTMKKFCFKIEAVPEKIHQKSNDGRRIKNEQYTLPENVKTWVKRVEDCNSLSSEAHERKGQLIKELTNMDRMLSNCLHSIELERWKNACQGYTMYRQVKGILEKRRIIKDELIMVSEILASDLPTIDITKIENLVEYLKTREFNVREVFIDDENLEVKKYELHRN